MNGKIQLNPIGSTHFENGRFCIKLRDEYKKGLVGIKGFSHLQILWWGNLFDAPKYRNQLMAKQPYQGGPEKLGVFATRSQLRPNPILTTIVAVQKIDIDQGEIYTPYMDTESNTPVLDIKPYHLFDRVENCHVPNWCRHWPSSYEKSAGFNWAAVFNF